jgi:molybdopterin converting factor small subunit
MGDADRDGRGAGGENLCRFAWTYGYSGRVQVRVLTFGVLRDIFGAADVPLELPDGATVGELLRILRGRTSNSAMSNRTDNEARDRLWQSLAVAVNREYSSPGALLHDSDEVALLPPVSGGCCAHGCYARGEKLASLAKILVLGLS